MKTRSIGESSLPLGFLFANAIVSSSETVNGSESSSFPAPPSRPAADSIMSSESGSPTDPFRIDDPEKSLSSVEKSMDAPKPSVMIPDDHKQELKSEPKPELKPELEHLCRKMDSRGLAKLLKSMVSDLPNIRERIHSLADVPEFRTQVQAALKLASKPADLVYRCSNYVKVGQTYVLMMELFVQMMGDEEIEISASTKRAALASARRWRNMYQASGGCDDDHRIQARGFLFFIVGFGISFVFARDYIMNLIILSYPSQISDTLRKSRALVPMIPDMIYKMLQHKLYGEAIDVAFTFGIEDKFPYELIIASLKKEFKELKEDFEKTSRGLKEMEKAWKDLSNRYLILIEALGDKKICLDERSYVAIRGLELSIRANIEEARLKSKTNDDSVDEGKKDEMEMEMEMEHPSFARRLKGTQLLRKRPGRVPDLPKHLFVELVPKWELKPELEHLCWTMDSRGLAKLLKSMVSDLPNIRERIHSLADVPEFRTKVQAALKLAPKPADLVYGCSNYVKDGQTYVLMMELFVQMMGDEETEVEISASTKRAALASARRWRNVYQASGGCDDDHRIQARGFLFFIVGFGISSVFARDYIMNLIILSYPSQISDTLRKSRALVPMIPDMINKMLHHKLYGEAIDVAFTFGIEDKFPYKPIVDSLEKDFEELKGDFERTSRGLKEMEKACIDLSRKYITLIEALSDHSISLDEPFRQVVHGIQTSILEACLKSKSNDDSVDDGRKVEMEMEHPLARRLTGDQLLRKRSRREPVIYNLI